MNQLDLKDKDLVLLISHALTTILPRVITAPTYIQYPAHLFHSIYKAVFINELISHRGCLEKMANTFFNMSRSSVTSANVFFNFRISSSLGFIRKCIFNVFQILSLPSVMILGWISKSYATSETFCPPCVIK
jgi:hypothetical protein